MSISAIASTTANISTGVADRVGSNTGLAGPNSDSFGSLLQAIGSNFSQTIEAAEVQSTAALTGQGSTQQVVEAVMSAERALNIATGIRDKVASAYLELTRMAI